MLFRSVVSPQGLTLNGQNISVAAYNIDGYNYFRLRDIAILLDFNILFDAGSGSIGLDLSAAYAE